MAKFLDEFEQGSSDWFRQRIGIPTASEFHKILSTNQNPTIPQIKSILIDNGIGFEKSSKKDELMEIFLKNELENEFPISLSGQFEKYMYDKIGEIMTGQPKDYFEPTYWMERGKKLEPEALQAYEFTRGVQDIRKIGFATTEDGFFGASPDFLVGNDGCGEIKCLTAGHHLEFVHKGLVKPEHILQTQGQLWVCEREWVDYVLYHPDLPIAPPIRKYRDDKLIKRLEFALNQFRAEMNNVIEDLQKRELWQVAMPVI